MQANFLVTRHLPLLWQHDVEEPSVIIKEKVRPFKTVCLTKRHFEKYANYFGSLAPYLRIF
jgi:hypothetical protein